MAILFVWIAMKYISLIETDKIEDYERCHEDCLTVFCKQSCSDETYLDCKTNCAEKYKITDEEVERENEKMKNKICEESKVCNGITFEEEKERRQKNSDWFGGNDGED